MYSIAEILSERIRPLTGVREQCKGYSQEKQLKIITCTTCIFFAGSVSVHVCLTEEPEAGVFVRKLSQLTRSAKLSWLTPGISSCSVESSVSQPTVYTSLPRTWSPNRRLRPNQTLVSYTLAGFA
jgi:hypothetical protein